MTRQTNTRLLIAAGVGLCAVLVWGMGSKCDSAAAKCGAGGCPLTAAKDAGCGDCAKPQAHGATIGTEALAALIQSKVPAVILDARSGKFDDGRRIAGAVSLTADAKDEDIAKAAPDKNALVITYCAGLTCPASGMLAERLRKMGYVNVVEYPQGIEGWVNAGNSVTQQGGTK